MIRENVPVIRHCEKMIQRFLDDQVKIICYHQHGFVRGQEGLVANIHRALPHIHIAMVHMTVIHVSVIHTGVVHVSGLVKLVLLGV